MGPRLRDVGERRAIEAARRRLGRSPDLGRGADDCAVLPLGRGRVLLASTDVLVGPTHVLPGTPPSMLGAFAVEVAVSDLAAMGGRPLGVMCALGLPPDTERAWLASLARGMATAARRHGTSVVGGDTKAAPAPTLAMTALGTARSDRCLYRRGARPGDVLLLTGPLGGPAIGYHELRRAGGSGMTPARRLAALRRVYGVRARVSAGLALAGVGGARACIDLSDGLGVAVHQLCEASGVGARIGWDALPLARGLSAAARGLSVDPVELALGFGGEYELLAAVRPRAVGAALEALRASGARSARAVGTVARGHEILLEREGGAVAISPVGFDHFKGGR